MLILKSYPVVLGLEYSGIENIHELHDAMIKEPISKRWVFYYSPRPIGTVVGIFYTKEMSKLWPLEVSSTMGEKECPPLLLNDPSALTRIVGFHEDWLQSLPLPTMSLNSSTDR